MSNLRLSPRLLILSVLSLLAAATAVRAQIAPGGRQSDGTPIIRSDPRVSPGVGGYPRSKDEMGYPAHNRPREVTRRANVSPVIKDARKALDQDPPDYLKANQLFRFAARLNPEDERAYVGLGDVNTALRRFPEAAAAYGKALQLKRDSGEAHYGLGVMYFAQGRKDAARDELEVLRSLKKTALALKLAFLLGD